MQTQSKQTKQLQAGADYVEKWLDYWHARSGVPGLSVSILHDKSVLLNRQFGHAELNPNKKLTSRHVFRMASQSKMLAAVAVGILHDRKLLQIDDPIAKHLPKLNQSPIGKIAMVKFLNHTSWIGREGPSNFADYWSFRKPFPAPGEFMNVSRKLTPIFRNSIENQYSNWGYGLIGQAIEHVSGLSYGDFISQNILRPLDMNRTRPDSYPDIKNLVTGYLPQVHGYYQPLDPALSLQALAPAAGLCSTTEEMAHFLLSFSQLLKPSTYRTLLAPASQLDFETSYGLGFKRVSAGRRIFVGHGGLYPGHESATYANPGMKLAISICANRQSAPAKDLALNIIHALTRFIDHDLAFQGRYRNIGCCFDALVGRASLLMPKPDDANAWKEAVLYKKTASGVYEARDRIGDYQSSVITFRKNKAIEGYRLSAQNLTYDKI